MSDFDREDRRKVHQIVTVVSYAPAIVSVIGFIGTVFVAGRVYGMLQSQIQATDATLQAHISEWQKKDAVREEQIGYLKTMAIKNSTNIDSMQSDLKQIKQLLMDMRERKYPKPLYRED